MGGQRTDQNNSNQITEKNHMRHFLLCTAIVLATVSFAQNSFFQSYLTDYYETGFDIISLDNGNLLISGRTMDPPMDQYQFLRFTDADGNEISTSYLHSENAKNKHLLCQDYDNSILILRDSTINDTTHMIITKINQEGQILNTHILTPGFGHGIYKDGDDGYFVLGKKAENGNNTYIIKADDSFSVSWAKEFYPTNEEFQITTPKSAIVLNDELFVSGIYIGEATYGYDRKTYILNVSNNGDSLNCLNLNEKYFQYYSTIIPSSDGNILTTGYYGDFISSDTGSILKISPNLEILWENTFYADYGLLCNDLIETSDGGIIICGGQLRMDVSRSNLMLKKVNSEGEEIWHNTFESGYDITAYDIALTQDGSILCTGLTHDSELSDRDMSFIIKTDSEGNLSGINNQPVLNKKIEISPNPASEKCAVLIHDIHGSSVTISVYNNSGQKVIEHNISEVQELLFSKTLELNNLNPGIYFIQISIDGIRETRKLVVN
ncbi:MAG: hypothetical protein C0593_13395 [Marinilabiliales bacterium]|nr:MAG: hypothetical protein C0593_13395 [Marinilabiliales bacterium]